MRSAHSTILKGLGEGFGEGPGAVGPWPPPQILSFLPPALRELPHLVHEGLEPRPGVALFLAVVGQVQEGDVVVALPEKFKQGVNHGAGHAGKGHDVDDAACAPSGKIDRLPNREDCFSFKGGIQVGFRLSEKRSCLGFTELSQMASKYFLQMMFVFFLIIVR